MYYVTLQVSGLTILIQVAQDITRLTANYNVLLDFLGRIVAYYHQTAQGNSDTQW
jgi:hypothetical protein